jgi:hypothetical protein
VKNEAVTIVGFLVVAAVLGGGIVLLKRTIETQVGEVNKSIQGLPQSLVGAVSGAILGR